MKVEYLVTVALPNNNSNHPEDEVIASARGLEEKYKRKTSPPIKIYNFTIFTRLIGIKNFITNSTYCGEQVDATVTESGNVGVYLVFHCDRFSGLPQIFDKAREGMKFQKQDDTMDSMARGVVKILTDLGLKKIRKLCLVACNTVNQSDSFLKSLLVPLAHSFESPPMIAGWDDYITVAPATGSKKGSGDQPITQEYRKTHKHVYLYKGGGYTESRFEESGWSDKEQLLTNQGPSSSFSYLPCTIL